MKVCLIHKNKESSTETMIKTVSTAMNVLQQYTLGFKGQGNSYEMCFRAMLFWQ
jgi:hypothetical protein